jgi:hypothetical protein
MVLVGFFFLLLIIALYLGGWISRFRFYVCPPCDFQNASLNYSISIWSLFRIDKKGYTILHHVTDTGNYDGGTKPGPALQFQEELKWFEVLHLHALNFILLSFCTQIRILIKLLNS